MMPNLVFKAVHQTNADLKRDGEAINQYAGSGMGRCHQLNEDIRQGGSNRPQDQLMSTRSPGKSCLKQNVVFAHYVKLSLCCTGSVLDSAIEILWWAKFLNGIKNEPYCQRIKSGTRFESVIAWQSEVIASVFTICSVQG
jgi:hypothetical protein